MGAKASSKGPVRMSMAMCCWGGHRRGPTKRTTCGGTTWSEQGPRRGSQWPERRGSQSPELKAVPHGGLSQSAPATVGGLQRHMKIAQSSDPSPACPPPYLGPPLEEREPVSDPEAGVEEKAGHSEDSELTHHCFPLSVSKLQSSLRSVWDF